MQYRVVIATNKLTQDKDYWIQYKAWGMWFDYKDWNCNKIVFKTYEAAKACVTQCVHRANGSTGDIVTSKVVNG